MYIIPKKSPDNNKIAYLSYNSYVDKRNHLIYLSTLLLSGDKHYLQLCSFSMQFMHVARRLPNHL